MNGTITDRFLPIRLRRFPDSVIPSNIITAALLESSWKGTFDFYKGRNERNGSERTGFAASTLSTLAASTERSDDASLYNEDVIVVCRERLSHAMQSSSRMEAEDGCRQTVPIEGATEESRD